MPELNLLNSYFLAGMAEEIVHVPSFFLDRYFSDSDTFSTEKVLIEFNDGDKKMAPFVDPNVGDIPVARDGYQLLELDAPLVAPSRILTTDDLKKRGFGESILPTLTHEERAKRLIMRDMQDLDKRIRRREEWMAIQAITTNGIVCQEMIDDKTTGRQLPIYFYDHTGSNPGAYTVGSQWTTFAAMQADVGAMCDDLTERSLPAEDLILGATTWATVKQFSDLQNQLDNRRIDIGEMKVDAKKFPGMKFVGYLEFDGYWLNVFVAKEKHIDALNASVLTFPAKGACVTAPGCGKRYYGSVDVIPEGKTDLLTLTGERIPDLVVDRRKKQRAFVLNARPLLAPKNKAPWIFAANVVA
ncbi:MAG: major capsid protein [Clostridia bacterium]|nr:major capsid protein [Clostridia bacterium]